MYTYSKALNISHVNCEIVPKPTPFIKMYLSQVYLETLVTNERNCSDQQKFKNGSIYKLDSTNTYHI